MRRTLAVLPWIVTLALVSHPAVAGGALQLRMGGFFPEGSGDLWESNEEDFTFESSDLEDLSFGVSWIAPLHNHVEIGLHVDFYDSVASSGYRDFTDQDGFAILHDTRLETMPMSVDVRVVPFGRFGGAPWPGGPRAVRPAVYLGGGIGATYWEYEEAGDFVDFEDPDLPVVYDRFADDGVAFAFHAVLGADFPLSRSTGVLFESRYTWADDEMSGDFEGFGTIDLSGWSLAGGLVLRF